MHITDAIILNSLNLSSYNLTLNEEIECLGVFKDWGRHKALDRARQLQQAKLYNGNIDTFNSLPKPKQIQQHELFSVTYKMIYAKMDAHGYLHMHIFCSDSSYYKVVEVSKRGNAAIKGVYKHYDFEKKEPYLKILLQTPPAK